MRVTGDQDLVFGGFRLSLRERALWGASGRLTLTSRAFDVLLALLECRDRVATKADLMRRVWGSLIVEENNLHVQIAAIRRALGTDSRWILTVPGKGYRFIGQVRVQPEIGAPALEGDLAPGGKLAAATARFWVEAGLAGEARSWLADALEVAPTAAQADMLARLQHSLADLSADAAPRV
jgi:DNA-binding winged helix-turn-helix (wHTH) protein